jgi:Tfp pilus assembly protein PilV
VLCRGQEGLRVNTTARRLRDTGESLIEILLTVVITGITITALIASLASAGKAGNVQRSNVRADVVMRSYAEATKAAARACTVGGSFTVVYIPSAGYTATGVAPATPCPATTAPLLLTLSVVGPLGVRDTMQIKVSTP